MVGIVSVGDIAVLDQPIQAAVQPILRGGREVHVEQLIQRRLQEPLAMNSILAAGIDQPIDGQDRHHLLILHLGEMGVELAHRLEFRGLVEAYQCVAVGLDLVRRLGRGHRYGTDQILGLPGSDGVEGSDHGGAGGQPVIHDNDDASGGIDGGAYRRVLGPAPGHHRLLGPDFGGDIGFVAARQGRVVRQVGPARFIHRTDGEFRIARGADLAHQHHIQFPPQGLGDDVSHGHPAPGNGQDQGIFSRPGLERCRQLGGSLGSILEIHGESPENGPGPGANDLGSPCPASPG